MSRFILKVENGKPSFGNEELLLKYRKWLSFREGKKIVIEDLDYESLKQRGFFEGAVVPMVVYLDGRDHTDTEECRKTREALKLEFNAEFTMLNGVSKKVAGSTKGKLNAGFVERVIDWMEDQYGIDRTVVLNPKDYKHWRDAIFSFGGPETYIDYLVEKSLLVRR